MPSIRGQALGEHSLLACYRIIARLSIAAHMHSSIKWFALQPRSRDDTSCTGCVGHTSRLDRVPSAARRWMRAYGVILSATGLCASGCASVTVATSEGQITARGIFGTSIHTLALAPVSISRQGIGVHQDRGSITLGWLAESAVYEPSTNDPCRIVLFESNPAQLGQLISVLRQASVDMTTVCSQPSGE